MGCMCSVNRHINKIQRYREIPYKKKNAKIKKYAFIEYAKFFLSIKGIKYILKVFTLIILAFPFALGGFLYMLFKGILNGDKHIVIDVYKIMGLKKNGK